MPKAAEDSPVDSILPYFCRSTYLFSTGAYCIDKQVYYSSFSLATQDAHLSGWPTLFGDGAVRGGVCADW